MTDQTAPAPTPAPAAVAVAVGPARRRLAAIGVATAAVGLSTFGIVSSRADQATPTATVQQQTLVAPPLVQDGYDPSTGGRRFPGQRAGSTSTGTTEVDATEAQEVGLVYVTTTLDTGQAAGTGMVLTSDGEILTNHHVVEGATSISVQVVSTGRTYDADVVGYDATHDVAVLQLDDASGLQTVTTDTAESVEVGDAVTGVGNANGDGGAASAAAGTVAAVDQSITVSSETGGASSRLTGLIEVDADIIPGDSGGALYDDDGEVVGMNTAASSGSADVTGYAVPIAQALSIADAITSGDAGGDVVIGGHGFLGVALSSDVTGALVAEVEAGSPAQDAGIVAGSTITSLNGGAVTSSDALVAAVTDLAVGDNATVAWTDPSGQAHSATVVLDEGPVG